MSPHVTCKTIVRPGSPKATRIPPERTRWSFPRLDGGPWERPSRPFPHLSGSPLGLTVRDLLHPGGAPSEWTRFTNLRGVPSGVIRLLHLRWAPSGRTQSSFPHLRWGCYCRGYVFPRRWPGSATNPTGLGPSVLFILLFLVASTTDVPLPLGMLHQQVHRHVGVLCSGRGAHQNAGADANATLICSLKQVDPSTHTHIPSGEAKRAHEPCPRGGHGGTGAQRATVLEQEPPVASATDQVTLFHWKRYRAHRFLGSAWTYESLSIPRNVSPGFSNAPMEVPGKYLQRPRSERGSGSCPRWGSFRKLPGPSMGPI